MVAVLAAGFALSLPAGASASKVALILAKAGTGMGTVTSSPAGISCGASCIEDTAEYAEGTIVTLTASPKAGSRFEGWFGCDSEPSPTQCKISVVEETTIEAEFNEIEKFPLTVEKAGTGLGTVTSSPIGISCGPACPGAMAEYLEGTTVILTASSSAGSRFEGWFGCDSEPSPTQCEITVLEETTIEAEFNEIEKFPLTVKKEGTGKGTVKCEVVGSGIAGACAAEYPEGTKLRLVAVADPGSEFGEWNGECDIAVANKCELEMSEERTVAAVFKLLPQVPFTVIEAGTGTGTVTCNGGACASSYSEGTEIALGASPAAGSSFTGWSGGGCSGTGACKLTIKAATTVTATFDRSATPIVLPGMANAARSAKVSGRTAALRLSCSGGPCKGTLKLIAKLRQSRKAKRTTIGSTSFTLRSGAVRTFQVRLSAAAKKALLTHGSLKASLRGTGIAASAIKLKLG